MNASTKTRTSIKTDKQGFVTLTYCPALGWDDDEVKTRVFMCPPDGGYVREQHANGDWSQICERLAVRGNTLRSPSREALAEVIRQEYRAMRRDDKRHGW